MSGRAVPVFPPESDSMVCAALARWRDDASIAPLVREGGSFLVLDGTADCVLYAAGAATTLRAGISQADGKVLPRLRLAEQIGRAGTLEGRPRLIRLRLDPRGVALPVVGLAVRAELEDGLPALVFAPVGAFPVLRPAEASPAKAAHPRETAPAVDAAVESGPAPEAQPAAMPVNPVAMLVDDADASVEVPSRFVWRSDAEGVLTHISRAHPDLAAVLEGRSWAMLAADGVVVGEAFFEALSARRTFRTLPLTVLGRSFEHRLEISGAPSGHARAAFPGFSGFAILGERSPRRLAAESVAAGEGSDEAAEAEPGLTVNEHAAFREVARLLGLRFAADEPSEDMAPPAPRGESASSGAIMPFPTPPGRLAEAEGRARAALTELLESLPLGVLIAREDELLFASRTLLDLTGYADPAALRRVGLPQLFRGLAPAGKATGQGFAAHAGGGTVSLLVDRASLLWDGAPAEIYLARPVPVGTAGEGETSQPNHAWLRAQTVLDSLEEGVVTLDAEGRVIGLNPSAAELVHAHPAEVVGGRFADLFSPASRSVLEAAVTDSRRSGTCELQGVTARSGAAALRLRIARLLGEEAPGYCASLREIRDAAPLDPARAMGEARQRDEAEAIWKANALARVSREIRPSLNAILSLTDMMLSDRFDRADAERLEAYLRDVRLSGGRIASLIDDLRDLAEIQAGRSKLTFTELALNDLVSSCIAARQAQAARHRIVLRTSLAPDLPRLKADERSIRQAALTVLGKAIHVTEAGGQVIVSTTLAERGEVALRVRDTGTGMTEDELLSALEPFRVAAASAAPSSSEGEGRGFGLTLTKALVEANRGRFRITSRKDEGTLVEMLFPAA
ncbi:MAG TPA: PAS domain-containing sensor histidine kinase [Methylorubrum populi]|uniref:histidine kinase n=1 Tax=Methylorubrum populi TaxID=223967 RepID=A0A921JEQ0_9HYPH|nr:PAS domain-containing sensor histidine kinase [Methylorubrum populi]